MKQAFEERGLLVLRSPASRSELDVVALSPRGGRFFVQCKKTSKDALYVYGLQPLVDLASRYNATPLLCYSLRRTPVYCRELVAGEFKAKRDERHVEFRDYLARSI